MLRDVFLAGGVRTPIGALSGELSEVPAPRLGAIAAFANRLNQLVLRGLVKPGDSTTSGRLP